MILLIRVLIGVWLCSKAWAKPFNKAFGKLAVPESRTTKPTPWLSHVDKASPRPEFGTGSPTPQVGGETGVTRNPVWSSGGSSCSSAFEEQAWAQPYVGMSNFPDEVTFTTNTGLQGIVPCTWYPKTAELLFEHQGYTFRPFVDAGASFMVPEQGLKVDFEPVPTCPPIACIVRQMQAAQTELDPDHKPAQKNAKGLTSNPLQVPTTIFSKQPEDSMIAKEKHYRVLDSKPTLLNVDENPSLEKLAATKSEKNWCETDLSCPEAESDASHSSDSKTSSQPINSASINLVSGHPGVYEQSSKHKISGKKFNGEIIYLTPGMNSLIEKHHYSLFAKNRELNLNDESAFPSLPGTDHLPRGAKAVVGPPTGDTAERMSVGASVTAPGSENHRDRDLQVQSIPDKAPPKQRSMEVLTRFEGTVGDGLNSKCTAGEPLCIASNQLDGDQQPKKPSETRRELSDVADRVSLPSALRKSKQFLRESSPSDVSLGDPEDNPGNSLAQVQHKHYHDSEEEEIPENIEPIEQINFASCSKRERKKKYAASRRQTKLRAPGGKPRVRLSSDAPSSSVNMPLKAATQSSSNNEIPGVYPPLATNSGRESTSSLPQGITTGITETPQKEAVEGPEENYSPVQFSDRVALKPNKVDPTSREHSRETSGLHDAESSILDGKSDVSGARKNPQALSLNRSRQILTGGCQVEIGKVLQETKGGIENQSSPSESSLTSKHSMSSLEPDSLQSTHFRQRQGLRKSFIEVARATESGKSPGFPDEANEPIVELRVKQDRKERVLSDGKKNSESAPSSSAGENFKAESKLSSWLPLLGKVGPMTRKGVSELAKKIKASTLTISSLFDRSSIGFLTSDSKKKEPSRNDALQSIDEPKYSQQGKQQNSSPELSLIQNTIQSEILVNPAEELSKWASKHQEVWLKKKMDLELMIKLSYILRAHLNSEGGPPYQRIEKIGDSEFSFLDQHKKKDAKLFKKAERWFTSKLGSKVAKTRLYLLQAQMDQYRIVNEWPDFKRHLEKKNSFWSPEISRQYEMCLGLTEKWPMFNKTPPSLNLKILGSSRLHLSGSADLGSRLTPLISEAERERRQSIAFFIKTRTNPYVWWKEAELKELSATQGFDPLTALGIGDALQFGMRHFQLPLFFERPSPLQSAITFVSLVTSYSINSDQSEGFSKIRDGLTWHLSAERAWLRSLKLNGQPLYDDRLRALADAVGSIPVNWFLSKLKDPQFVPDDLRSTVVNWRGGWNLGHLVLWLDSGLDPTTVIKVWQKSGLENISSSQCETATIVQNTIKKHFASMDEAKATKIIEWLKKESQRRSPSLAVRLFDIFVGMPDSLITLASRFWHLRVRGGRSRAQSLLKSDFV